MIGTYESTITGEVYEITVQKKDYFMKYCHDKNGNITKPTRLFALSPDWNKFNSFKKIS